ncbi:hypothetical protein CHARACLAT_032028 [Characodon lateralis]|uniref:Tc1-like transposase DDE domain-containing protein n=1 Tax=Characodon lateralis TaxID=208331 RepID=A0ABU7E5A9_9TELE|nr:hypothetical protein [Characodon lateralis]
MVLYQGSGRDPVLPKNVAMDETWDQNVLQEQCCPTTQRQFGDGLWVFQPDGAPGYKTRVITKLLKDLDMEMLDLWSGCSPDLNPAENLTSVFKRQMEKQKPTK